MVEPGLPKSEMEDTLVQLQPLGSINYCRLQDKQWRKSMRAVLRLIRNLGRVRLVPIFLLEFLLVRNRQFLFPVVVFPMRERLSLAPASGAAFLQ